MALSTAQLAADVTALVQTSEGGSPMLLTAILKLVTDLSSNAGTTLPTITGGDSWDSANVQLRRLITGIVP